MDQIQKYGPYGSQSAKENFEFKLEEGDRLTEVIIRSGYIVDAIGFTKLDQNQVPYNKMYGGNGGQVYKITLQLGESITGISGKAKNSMISNLKIYTDRCQHGHGPFGTNEFKGGCEFNSPALQNGESIVGFLGSETQTNLASIGLYVQKATNCPN